MPTHPSRTARLAGRLLRTRAVVRAPILLYRARLGRLLGDRLLLLEHRGRTTGRRRYTVLEVVDHDAGRYVVVSGFGENAQWYRNVMANSAVRVSTGRLHRIPAAARRLTDAEAAEALQRYRDRHPRAWARLAPVLEETLGARIDERGTTLPLVALETPQGRVDRLGRNRS
ncbi:nitroreductase family deazaflavin-dependent oxidoreductase [Nocardioides sp. KR10-350]|uniref:nitroreductase family deazaflavin-dependent oxidoreductase n=1 Tax=Nocardioides cheoyonin TaxID=3156615 RepID=UPI0032B34E0F